VKEVHHEPQPHGIAQHPSRMARGVQLIPLIILVVCVVAATVAGLVVDARDDGASGKPSKKEGGQAAGEASGLPASCAPAAARRPTKEPWSGAARKRSERVFQARIRGEQPSYVRGEHGWLYFTDWQIDDFSQALGRASATKAQVRAWADYLAGLESAASSRGSRFYIVIAPAKWDVYPQYLPEWARKLRGTTTLDKLRKAHPELPFIDPRAALQEAGSEDPTYEPLDSHWTPYGGYVAWQAITDCLRKDAPEEFRGAGVPAIRGVGAVKASNEFERVGIVPPSEPVRTVPEYAAPLVPTKARSIATGERLELGPDHVIDTTQTPVQLRSPGAQTQLHLLALRDSTGNALSPLWSETFATVTQYVHPVGCPPETCATLPSLRLGSLLDEVEPDVTLLVMTERYLGYGPPT